MKFGFRPRPCAYQVMPGIGLASSRVGYYWPASPGSEYSPSWARIFNIPSTIIGWMKMINNENK